MEPIKLRGHHIFRLKDYASDPEKNLREARVYGEEFVRNLKNTFDNILKDETSIIIVDSFDDLCVKCNIGNDNGCQPTPRFFVPADYIAEIDRGCAYNLGLEIGVVYESSTFLQKVGIAKDVRKKRI